MSRTVTTSVKHFMSNSIDVYSSITTKNHKKCHDLKTLYKYRKGQANHTVMFAYESQSENYKWTCPGLYFQSNIEYCRGELYLTFKTWTWIQFSYLDQYYRHRACEGALKKEAWPRIKRLKLCWKIPQSTVKMCNYPHTNPRVSCLLLNDLPT